MIGVVSRLRRSLWTLPLAGLAAVLVLGINEGAYHGARDALTGLGRPVDSESGLITMNGDERSERNIAQDEVEPILQREFGIMLP